MESKRRRYLVAGLRVKDIKCENIIIKFPTWAPVSPDGIAVVRVM